MRLVPLDDLEIPYVAPEIDAAQLAVVPFQATHARLFANFGFEQLRRVRLYLGARSASEDRLRSTWRFRPEWVFHSRTAACEYMEREVYRRGYWAHVLEMPALLAEHGRDGLLISNLGWAKAIPRDQSTQNDDGLCELLQAILADSRLLTRAAIRQEQHQPLLAHLLDRNQLRGWVVPGGHSWAWPDDTPTGNTFCYQILTRAYHRVIAPDAQLASQESRNSLAGWSRAAFEPF